MDKILVIISCPIDTYSGYGARSRDFVKAFMANSKYDIKVVSQRWGNTSFGYLEEHGEHELASLIIPQVTSRPDIWIQITVPNEFQKVGKYNIGVTAGIETTICDASWIDGCNRMDLVLTSSNHSKNVFEATRFTENDQAGNPIRELKLTTPVEVLFEGADLTKYFKTSSSFDLNSIKEQFCFLFVGTWLQGDYGQDRKNLGFTIKSFLETFKNKQDQPALILKTSLGTSSHMNTDIILRKIESIRKTVKGKLPNIYLIDGELTDEEVNNLYNHNKVKAMISFTKGEGFGRPLLEFSLTGKPIVASNWSGHLDFLDKEFVHLVGGSLTKVHKSAASKGMILEEASWFTPDDSEVGKAYKSIIKNYKQHSEVGKRQAFKSKTDFSFDKMKEVLHTILDKSVPDFPKQVELKLPTLTLPKFKV
jgi:glycosyltransferase involved in cell wall biosynthesis